VSEVLQNRRIGNGAGGRSVGLLGVFAAWRRQAYGYTLAAAYALFFVLAYKWGMWLVDSSGTPIMVMLMGFILRRVFRDRGEPEFGAAA